MSAPSSPRTPAPSKSDQDMLFRGITCILIGLAILLAPYLARAESVRELMGQATLVGWFALALGVAFSVQYARRRARAKRGANPTKL